MPPRRRPASSFSLASGFLAASAFQRDVLAGVAQGFNAHQLFRCRIIFILEICEQPYLVQIDDPLAIAVLPDLERVAKRRWPAYVDNRRRQRVSSGAPIDNRD